MGGTLRSSYRPRCCCALLHYKMQLTVMRNQWMDGRRRQTGLGGQQQGQRIGNLDFDPQSAIRPHRLLRRLGRFFSKFYILDDRRFAIESRNAIQLYPLSRAA